jgi:hypothetical protein
MAKKGLKDALNARRQSSFVTLAALIFIPISEKGEPRCYRPPTNTMTTGVLPARSKNI